MAIAINNPDLHEGRRIVVWQVVPNPATIPGPGPHRRTPAVKGEGVVVAGGIDYDRQQVTIQTDNGQLLTAPLSEVDFAS